MVYKEIDQRSEPKGSLMIQCNCGRRNDHFLIFEYDTHNWDETEWLKSMYVTIALPPYGLWGRIKKAFKYIISGGSCWLYDIGITESDINKIEALFAEYKALSMREESGE